MRFIISTTVQIGEESWPIELSLAKRDELGFRLLLGRRAMHRRLIVDPARSFQANKTERRRKNLSRAARPAVSHGGEMRPARLPNDEEE